ncbi:MAG: protein-disulfide reductase DsbD family protein [Xanthomonadales bacterium]|nr:protein-disulfide reductase DsbD family protein [Xanthomonadales bacterium]
MRAEDPERLRIDWEIRPGFYLYRHRLALESEDPAIVLGTPELPPGQPIEDEFFGRVEVYREAVAMTVPLTRRPAAAVRARLELRAQGCADLGLCYPPQRLSLELALPALPAPLDSRPLATGPGSATAFAPAGTLPGLPGSPDAALPLPPEQAFRSEAIALGPDRLLLRLSPAPGYYLYRDRTRIAVREPGFALGPPEWPAARVHRDEHFGEVMVFFEPVEVPVPLLRKDAAARELTLELVLQGCQDEGICYPPMTRTLAVALPAGTGAAAPAEAPQGGGGLALWLLSLAGAFLGGVLLNLMPCVLPVLSLKALALAASGDAGERRGHALAYTAGVLSSFLLLGLGVIALRASGLALGWGFQLQQPVVVALLAYVMFAVGLALSGAYQAGAGLAGLGSGLAARPGRVGDFFTGVLAVVVASPCTAPFMGAALAYAAAAPLALALPVFLSLGLGLAAPFLLIGFVPALARWLPRPGRWMEDFKRAMAFPMYGAAVWLAWVLGRQAGSDAVAALLAGAVPLAGALLLLEGARGRRAPWRRALALAMLLLALAVTAAIPRLGVGGARAPAPGEPWQAFSTERLAALRRAGHVVFVNVTADWCITCKANERRVLEGAAFREALAAANGVYLRGDWTRMDPEITAFLEAHGAVGVPLYVVFPPGEGPGRRLPVILDEALVREAILAARKQGG